MADTKYDYVEYVRIGATDVDYTQIDDLVYYAERLVTPMSQGELEPIEVINQVKPDGVSGRFKHWEFIIAIDSDNYEAMYEQDVIDVGTGYAMRDSDDNDPIGYILIRLVDSDGGADNITFESEKIACVSRRSRYSNRENVEFQVTEYRFVAWGNRSGGDAQ
jgi:hypothetical protein